MKLIFIEGQNGVKCIEQKKLFEKIDMAYIDIKDKDIFFNFKDNQIKIGDVLVTFNEKHIYETVYNEILKNI